MKRKKSRTVQQLGGVCWCHRLPGDDDILMRSERCWEDFH